jgi:uncharacterized protein (DUF427 family)
MATREQRIPGSDHPIVIEPSSAHVIVRAHGQVIADSSATLTLREAAYPAVHYVPLADVDEAALRPSASASYCPYKGDASYYSVAGPNGEIVDAIWTYREPYAAVEAIAGYVAFYPDRVDVSVE